MKNTKGITLIALVITIIVLLILAGVSINLVVGDSGILTKATNAKTETEIAEEKEKISLSLTSVRMNDVENIDRQITAQELEDEINNTYGAGTVEVSGEDTLVVKYSKSERNYKITNKGKPTEITKEEAELESIAKNTEQKVSTAIGIDEDGNAVNMDLWQFEKKEDGKGYNLGYEDEWGYGYPAYEEKNIIDGKIQGKIPVYIKEKDGSFLPVTSLRYAFAGCTTLVEAPKIPDSITDMYYTFFNCKSLVTSPKIPDSVTNLARAFEHCEKLIELPEIPDGVIDMSYTFYGCILVTTPTKLPSKVTNLEGTFGSCTNLTTAPKIPDGVINLAATFSKCEKITTAPEIPESVINMSSTFNSTSITNTPEIPNKVSNMSHTFYNTNITECTKLPDSVTDMVCTFSNCTKLRKAPNIPPLVTSLFSTFSNCTSLEEAPVMNNTSVKQMYETFKGCTSLKVGPVLPNSLTALNGTFVDCTGLVTAPIIPASVTYIGRTFKNCTNLTGTLEINANVTAANNYKEFLTGAATATGTNLVLTGSNTVLSDILSTKSSNSNITLGS